MESQAVLRYARVSPRKVRLVADLVRGKPLPEAIAQLGVTQKRAAPIVAKLLRSAAANAADRHGSDVDQLWVKRIFVDQGPTLQRWMTRAHGSASPMRHRTSHITVVVDDEKK